ncbi:hypothetical protein Drorol1_Dr00021265 [Drosera rotundifolia]
MVALDACDDLGRSSCIVLLSLTIDEINGSNDLILGNVKRDYGRISFCRKLILDYPKILLLDEATSTLDAESEQVFQEALDRVMANRRTVVVAHRLTTIKGADKIAVVKNGAIVEQGKHESLLRIRDGVCLTGCASYMRFILVKLFHSL